MRKNIYLTILTFILVAVPVLQAEMDKPQDALQMLHLLAFGNVAELKYKMGGEPGGETPALDDAG